MLLETLRTLAVQTVSAQAVVIDNGSSDGSVDQIRREFSDALVLGLDSNIGFGPALNAGVAEHPAEILVFSNNDVLFEPRFVEALLEELGHSESVVAGVLLQDADPGLIDSAGVVVDSTLFAFDYLHDLPVSAAGTAAAPLGPTGGAALVPLSTFNSVGGFDERIFAYLEDVDLALRLRANGVTCRLAAEARAVHRHSATLGSGSAAKNRLMGWSRGYQLRRYGILRRPGLGLRALTTETVVCAGQLLVDHNAVGIGSRLRGWHAARNLERLTIPPGAALEIRFGDALRRRAARRVDHKRRIHE
jgi:N-acetylglucosaminyl-diphospho-decaprenol L-rhamnosyltransferase